jgi:hypothetical protein
MSYNHTLASFGSGSGCDLLYCERRFLNSHALIHSGFAAKNWFLHIQCATMFPIMLVPVVLVFGFTRTDCV